MYIINPFLKIYVNFPLKVSRKICKRLFRLVNFSFCLTLVFYKKYGFFG